MDSGTSVDSLVGRGHVDSEAKLIEHSTKQGALEHAVVQAEKALLDSSVETAAAYRKALAEMQEKLVVEEALRRSADRRSLELLERLEGAQTQLVAAKSEAARAERQKQERVTELQEQLSAQQSRLHAAEISAAEGREQLKALQRGPSQRAESEAPAEEKGSGQQDLALVRCPPADEEPGQVANQIKMKTAVQKMADIFEKGVARHAEKKPSKELSSPSQLAQHEVCELKQQLLEELSRRKSVHYQVIERDRRICKLQEQLREAARPCASCGCTDSAPQCLPGDKKAATNPRTKGGGRTKSNDRPLVPRASRPPTGNTTPGSPNVYGVQYSITGSALVLLQGASNSGSPRPAKQSHARSVSGGHCSTQTAVHSWQRPRSPDLKINA